MTPKIKGLAVAVASAGLSFLAACCFSGGSSIAAAQESGTDEAPKVKIILPANNSTAAWNSLVNYSIVVTYQGKSTEYQEIPSNQVLLETTYVPDLSAAAESTPAPRPAPPGLLDITRSNCLGCHEFKAKAMGPSFAAIAAKYPDNQASIDALSKYIREGSTGVWGQASMPPHADLTSDQLHAIAQWIAKNAANPNVNYYVGTEGAIRMESLATPNPKGGMILTATYTSPASPAKPGQASFGQDTVILHGR